MARRRTLQNTVYDRLNFGTRVPIPLNPFEERTLLHRMVIKVKVGAQLQNTSDTRSATLTPKEAYLLNMIEELTLKHGGHRGTSTEPEILLQLTGEDLYYSNQLDMAPPGSQWGSVGKRLPETIEIEPSSSWSGTLVQLFYIPFSIPKLKREKDTALPAWAWHDWTLEVALASNITPTDLWDISPSPDSVSLTWTTSPQVLIYQVYEREGRSVEIPLKHIVQAQDIHLTQSYTQAYYTIPLPAYIKRTLLVVKDQDDNPSDDILTEVRILSNGEVIEHMDALAFKDLLELNEAMEFPVGLYPIDLSAFNWKGRKLISVVKGHTWALQLRTSAPAKLHLVHQRVMPMTEAEKLATATLALGPDRPVKFQLRTLQHRVITERPEILAHPLPMKISPEDEEEEEE